jgi:hypothetical protein
MSSDRATGAAWPRRWRALLLGLGSFAAAAGVHGLFHVLGVPARMPRPWLSAVPWLLACVAVAAMLASTATSVRRAKPLGRKLAAGLLHVLLALGGLAGVLASDPTFPFGPTVVEWTTLPDDRGTAYLYKQALFCQQTVWRSRAGQWWSERDDREPGYTCDREGHLQWDPQAQRVRVVGTDGKPLLRAQQLDGLGEALYWGPH